MRGVSAWYLGTISKLDSVLCLGTLRYRMEDTRLKLDVCFENGYVEVQ